MCRIKLKIFMICKIIVERMTRCPSQLNSVVLELVGRHAGRRLPAQPGPPGQGTRSPHARAWSYLHGILCLSSFMHTSLAHGVGAHPDVLLDLIAIGEVYVVPV